MIPKVIHYCWFGHNPKPEIVKKCIDSWKQYCPDYEIIEWNEENFDVGQIEYSRAAYEDKKWAFVSDYARLCIVYNRGGIYLDTDVLLRRDLDELLEYDCWLASNDVRYVATGLGFGACKGNALIGAMMQAYASYEYPSGTNVTRDTIIVERELSGWMKSDQNQVIDNTLIVGMRGYSAFASHLYLYTWADEDEKARREQEIEENKPLKGPALLKWRFKCLVRSPRLVRFFDKRRGSWIEKIYTFLAYDLVDCGILYYIMRLFAKMKSSVSSKQQ